MSKFYESLIRGDYYEKTASEKKTKEDIAENLKGLSNEEIESLAEELDLFDKTAHSVTVEEMETEKALANPSVSEQAHSVRDKTEDKTNPEDVQEFAKKQIDHGSTVPEDAQETAKKQLEKEDQIPTQDDEAYRLANDAPKAGGDETTPGEKTPPADVASKDPDQVTAGDEAVKTAEEEEEDEEKEEKEKKEKKEKKDDEDEEKETKTAGEILNEMAKTASEEVTDEEIIEKAAFTRAEYMLKEAGYTVGDYIYSIVDNEKLAQEIYDKSEKLASVKEEPIMKVARDLTIAIVNNME